MADKREAPKGRQQRPAKPEEAPKVEGRPVTTGDMQEVGATDPEEVLRRRRQVDGEAPVHENPGDQNSG
jgi:hypothetical protein